MQTQPQHQFYITSSNQTNSQVEILHLPQGLITSCLKEENIEGKEGGKERYKEGRVNILKLSGIQVNTQWADKNSSLGLI